MRSYTTIFFDLDHTLWDFDKNCAETLAELYDHYQLSQFAFDVLAFQTTYRYINDTMWEGYHRNEITQEELRNERFKRTFEQLGIHSRYTPDGIDKHFIELCPTKPHLHDDALPILDYLTDKKYSLHILTNGFPETQFVKMKHSGLAPYFEELIHSAMSGFKKPDLQMYQFALNKTNADAKDSIMIGDDLHADVLGAKAAGLGHVFYNPSKKLHTARIDHEIHHLSELKNIL